jgi:hypothetical protein
MANNSIPFPNQNPFPNQINFQMKLNFQKDVSLKFRLPDDLVVGFRRVELLQQVVERLLRDRRERDVDDAVTLNTENKTFASIMIYEVKKCYIFT